MATIRCHDCGVAMLQSMGGGLDESGRSYSLCGPCAKLRIAEMRASGVPFAPPPDRADQGGDDTEEGWLAPKLGPPVPERGD